MTDDKKTDGSVTRELREFAHYISADDQCRKAYEIADTIDVLHAAAMAKAYDDGFASADDWYADKSDADLAEHGLVRLPVDADGRPWKFGDCCNNGEKLRAIHLYANGNGRLDFSGGTKMEIIKGSSTTSHYKPTPAERIRKLAKDVGCCSDFVDEGSRIRFSDALYAIADELEADDGRD